MALATEWYPEIGVKNSWDLDGAQEEPLSVRSERSLYFVAALLSYKLYKK